MSARARTIAAAVAAIATTQLAAAADPTITLDGRFDDWADTTPLATDPAGDATGAFDITGVSAHTEGPLLYMKLDLAPRPEGPVNLQSGNANDGTLRINFKGKSPLSLTLDTRARKVNVTTGGDTIDGKWTKLEYYALPTHAAETYELRFDLKLLRAVDGDTVNVTFSGSDSLDAPIAVDIRGERPTPTDEADWQPADNADARIVCFNTEHNGLTNAARAPRIARMLRAASPDILFLQEEWDTTPEQAREALDAARITSRNTEADDPWNVHAAGNGTIIASRLPIIPIKNDTGARFTVAVIQLPSGKSVAAVSVHFKCCGHTGSDEDRRRIEEASAVAETIRLIRNAPKQSPLHKHRNATVVVAGDWNLVGSRAPLDILTQQGDSAPALKRANLLSLDHRSGVTWFREASNFSPGALDLLAYSPENTTLERAYILDTRRLAAPVLREMGLQGDDSRLASDHLMLVADISINPAEDE